MNAKDIIDKHKTLEENCEMFYVHNGVTYHGGRTEKLDKIIKDLEDNGFKVGSDCGSLRENGTAIIYTWKVG